MALPPLPTATLSALHELIVRRVSSLEKRLFRAFAPFKVQVVVILCLGFKSSVCTPVRESRPARDLRHFLAVDRFIIFLMVSFETKNFRFDEIRFICLSWLVLWCRI